MIEIIVASRSQAFFDTLCAVVGPGFSPVPVGIEAMSRREGESGAGDVRECHQIIVCREPVALDARKIEISRAVAVVDSQNPALLEQLALTGLLAITCGLSARDTITLSSIDTDRAVINLQRSITCFDGSIAEPQEFPVRAPSSLDRFLLMAVAGVWILSGQADRLCQIDLDLDKMKTS